MHNQATSPQAIVSKLRECRFFLLLMADYEKVDSEKVSFCISAFLCAFRSAQYRLLGVVKDQHGDDARKTIKQKLGEDVEIKFLADRRDLEIHGDGGPVYELRMLYPEDLKQATTRVRIDHNILGWRIDNRPENPIVMFHDTLNALEQIVREANILPN